MFQNLKNPPDENTLIPLWTLWCCWHGSQFLVLSKRCSLMQSLHVYDYFCYWEWNLEGNFVRRAWCCRISMQMPEGLPLIQLNQLQTTQNERSRLWSLVPDSTGRLTKCAVYPGPTLTYTALVDTFDPLGREYKEWTFRQSRGNPRPRANTCRFLPDKIGWM